MEAATQDDISTRLIIVVEILGGIRGVAQHIDGVALQQRTNLRLVIRGDIVWLRYWLGENVTIALISIPGADERAYTMLRLGIEISDVTTAEVVNHEAMRWQRVQRLFPSGIVGEMHFEARGGQIKTVLVEEWFTRRFRSQQ